MSKHWTKTEGGYSLDGHVISKRGRRHVLTLADGTEHDLGTRGTFDDAEAVIAKAASL